MREYFGVIGKVVKGSGFEDIIFQSGACSTGSLNGVWMGSYYNRAWTVHSAFSETLERLLNERFIFEYSIFISEDFITAAEVPQSFYEDIVSSNATFLSRYQEFKESIRKGELFIHLEVQDNNFEMRLRCWKFYLPLYFALQKTNNARYGSYNVKVGEIREVKIPWCRFTGTSSVIFY